MCGIAGYLGGKPDKKILKKMTDRIKHRGPDAEGFYIDEKVGLADLKIMLEKLIKEYYGDKAKIRFRCFF